MIFFKDKQIIKNNIILKNIIQPYINNFYDNNKKQIQNINNLKNQISIIQIQKNIEIKKIRNKKIYIDFYDRINNLIEELNNDLYLYNKNNNINSIIALKKDYYINKKNKVKEKLKKFRKTKKYWISYSQNKINSLYNKKNQINNKYYQKLKNYDLEIEDINKNTKIEIIEFMNENKATIEKNYNQINYYVKKLSIYKNNFIEKENIENLISILEDENIFLKTEENNEIKKIKLKNAKLITNISLKKDLNQDIFKERLNIINAKIIKYEKKINKFNSQIIQYENYYNKIHYKTLEPLIEIDNTIIILTNLQITDIIKEYNKNIQKEKFLYNFINSKFNLKLSNLNKRIYHLQKYNINNLDNEILLLKKHNTRVLLILKKARLGLL